MIGEESFSHKAARMVISTLLSCPMVRQEYEMKKLGEPIYKLAKITDS